MMLPIILVLVLKSSTNLAEPDADPTDGLLRSEIESAASESRALADELADMLLRLEAEEDRADAVEAAVVGNENKVESALKEMIEKMEDLAEASEDSNNKVLKGSTEQKQKEENELKETVEQLELVAKQIETASSVKDVETIDDMAKILQSVNDKIEGKLDEGSKENVEEFKFKVKDTTALELNGIDEMIRTLEKVTDDLRELHDDVDISVENEETENIEDILNKNKISNQKLGTSSTDAENTVTNSLETKRERNGKSLSFESETSYGLIRKSNDKETDVKNETETDERPRGPKELKDDEPVEDCVDKEATNKVKVCVPKFITVDNSINLYSGEIKEERHCFDVTKTICEESSQIVSKEVCVYSYNQKTVVAPAQMTEVTFERREEKFEVTKCVKEKLKSAGYKEKILEVCKQDYVEAPYRLPAIIDNVDDFLELNIPEPDMRCQVYRYDIPEVSCQDVTTRECSEVAHVAPITVTEYLDTVQTDYKGRCGHRVLEQQQQECTLTQNVKRSRPGYQG